LENEVFPDLSGNSSNKQEQNIPLETNISLYKEKVKIECPEIIEEKKSLNNGMLILNKEIYFKFQDEIEENKKYFHISKKRHNEMKKFFEKKQELWDEIEEMDEKYSPFNYNEFYGILDNTIELDYSSDESDVDSEDDYDDYYYYY